MKGVLKQCDGKPGFIVDNAQWLRDALLQLGMAYHHQAREKRSLIESAFSSFKQRTKNLQQHNSQPKTQHASKVEEAVECWNTFSKMFTYYYNNLRRVP